MTSDPLQARSKKQLADMARKEGVAGWQSMPKEALVKALGRARARHKPAENRRHAANGKPAVNGRHVLNGKPAISGKPVANGKPIINGAKPIVNGTAAKVSKPARPQRAAARDTSTAAKLAERGKIELTPARDPVPKSPKDLSTGCTKDRVVVMVRDPYWLHAYWELTHQAVQRAEAALGQDWHSARPILRLFDVSSQETTATSETPVRDIEIHGGCTNWYLEVTKPPRSFRVDVGYVSKRGQFYVLARSNVVSTPKAGVSDQIDENWSDLDPSSADRILSMSSGFEATHAINTQEMREMFEERLRRPLGPPAVTGFGPGATVPAKVKKFFFQLDAELIVYGTTQPNARVTLQGEPVKLRPDGTFTMRFSLPDGRQIIPAVASSSDGVEERTIVLAVERNTKALEPMIHEFNDVG
jgi:hypothetical protein